MTADRPQAIDKKISRTVLGATAGLLATVAILSDRGVPSAEAAILAAAQLGTSSRPDPDKTKTKALDCSPAIGFQIPPSKNGPVNGVISAEVHMSVSLVGTDGAVIKDVTNNLNGDLSYNLVNLNGEVLRAIDRTPKVKVDYGFTETQGANAYESPIGRAVFNSGQLNAHLEEIRRFDHKDGSHTWDPVSPLIAIARRTAIDLKAYKDECGGNKTVRRFTIVYPYYLYLSQQYEAGQPIEVADGCLTSVNFNSEHFVATPPKKPEEPNNQQPEEPTVQQPIKPSAPAQVPAQVPVPIKPASVSQ